jgi:hypothetical protein
MGKYRKRPIEVEAEQFFPTQKPWPEGVEQFERERTEAIQGDCSLWYGWRINTLEGPLAVSPGDWIITGIEGEKYPCKPDIFGATYDAVDHPNTGAVRMCPDCGTLMGGVHRTHEIAGRFCKAKQQAEYL